MRRWGRKVLQRKQGRKLVYFYSSTSHLDEELGGRRHQVVGIANHR